MGKKINNKKKYMPDGLLHSHKCGRLWEQDSA